MPVADRPPPRSFVHLWPQVDNLSQRLHLPTESIFNDRNSLSTQLAPSNYRSRYHASHYPDNLWDYASDSEVSGTLTSDSLQLLERSPSPMLTVQSTASRSSARSVHSSANSQTPSFEKLRQAARAAVLRDRASQESITLEANRRRSRRRQAEDLDLLSAMSNPPLEKRAQMPEECFWPKDIDRYSENKLGGTPRKADVIEMEWHGLVEGYAVGPLTSATQSVQARSLVDYTVDLQDYQDNFKALANSHLDLCAKQSKRLQAFDKPAPKKKSAVKARSKADGLAARHPRSLLKACADYHNSIAKNLVRLIENYAGPKAKADGPDGYNFNVLLRIVLAKICWEWMRGTRWRVGPVYQEKGCPDPTCSGHFPGGPEEVDSEPVTVDGCKIWQALKYDKSSGLTSVIDEALLHKLYPEFQATGMKSDTAMSIMSKTLKPIFTAADQPGKATGKHWNTSNLWGINIGYYAPDVESDKAPYVRVVLAVLGNGGNWEVSRKASMYTTDGLCLVHTTIGGYQYTFTNEVVKGVGDGNHLIPAKGWDYHQRGHPTSDGATDQTTHDRKEERMAIFRYAKALGFPSHWGEHKVQPFTFIEFREKVLHIKPPLSKANFLPGGSDVLAPRKIDPDPTLCEVLDDDDLATSQETGGLGNGEGPSLSTDKKSELAALEKKLAALQEKTAEPQTAAERKAASLRAAAKRAAGLDAAEKKKADEAKAAAEKKIADEAKAAAEKKIADEARKVSDAAKKKEADEQAREAAGGKATTKIVSGTTTSDELSEITDVLEKIRTIKEGEARKRPNRNASDRNPKRVKHEDGDMKKDRSQTNKEFEQSVIEGFAARGHVPMFAVMQPMKKIGGKGKDKVKLEPTEENDGGSGPENQDDTFQKPLLIDIDLDAKLDVHQLNQLAMMDPEDPAFEDDGESDHEDHEDYDALVTSATLVTNNNWTVRQFLRFMAALILNKASGQPSQILETWGNSKEFKTLELLANHAFPFTLGPHLINLWQCAEMAHIWSIIRRRYTHPFLSLADITGLAENGHLRQTDGGTLLPLRGEGVPTLSTIFDPATCQTHDEDDQLIYDAKDVGRAPLETRRIILLGEISNDGEDYLMVSTATPVLLHKARFQGDQAAALRVIDVNLRTIEIRRRELQAEETARIKQEQDEARAQERSGEARCEDTDSDNDMDTDDEPCQPADIRERLPVKVSNRQWAVIMSNETAKDALSWESGACQIVFNELARSVPSDAELLLADSNKWNANQAYRTLGDTANVAYEMMIATPNKLSGAVRFIAHDVASRAANNLLQSNASLLQSSDDVFTTGLLAIVIRTLVDVTKKPIAEQDFAGFDQLRVLAAACPTIPATQAPPSAHSDRLTKSFKPRRSGSSTTGSSTKGGNRHPSVHIPQIDGESDIVDSIPSIELVATRQPSSEASEES